MDETRPSSRNASLMRCFGPLVIVLLLTLLGTTSRVGTEKGGVRGGTPPLLQSATVSPASLNDASSLPPSSAQEEQTPTAKTNTATTRNHSRRESPQWWWWQGRVCFNESILPAFILKACPYRQQEDNDHHHAGRGALHQQPSVCTLPSVRFPSRHYPPMPPCGFVKSGVFNRRLHMWGIAEALRNESSPDGGATTLSVVDEMLKRIAISASREAQFMSLLSRVHLQRARFHRGGDHDNNSSSSSKNGTDSRYRRAPRLFVPIRKHQKKNKTEAEQDDDREEFVQLPYFTAPEAIAILAKLTERGRRPLLFSGDSTVRETFVRLVAFLRGHHAGLAPIDGEGDAEVDSAVFEHTTLGELTYVIRIVEATDGNKTTALTIEDEVIVRSRIFPQKGRSGSRSTTANKNNFQLGQRVHPWIPLTEEVMDRSSPRPPTNKKIATILQMDFVWQSTLASHDLNLFGGAAAPSAYSALLSVPPALHIHGFMYWMSRSYQEEIVTTRRLLREIEKRRSSSGLSCVRQSQDGHGTPTANATTTVKRINRRLRRIRSLWLTAPLLEPQAQVHEEQNELLMDRNAIVREWVHAQQNQIRENSELLGVANNDDSEGDGSCSIALADFAAMVAPLATKSRRYRKKNSTTTVDEQSSSQKPIRRDYGCWVGNSFIPSSSTDAAIDNNSSSCLVRDAGASWWSSSSLEMKKKEDATDTEYSLKHLRKDDKHFMCTFDPKFPRQITTVKQDQFGCQDYINLGLVQWVLHYANDKSEARGFRN